MINQFENTHIIIFLGIEVRTPHQYLLPCSASHSGTVLVWCTQPNLHEPGQGQSKLDLTASMC